MGEWKLSLGTAAAVGLRQLKTETLPTVAYIMLGERCLRNCAFCAQGRESNAESKFLSRVAWHGEESQRAAEAIASAYAAGKIHHACLQVVQRPDSAAAVYEALELLSSKGVPVVVSGYITSPTAAADIFARGARRISIALDVASEEFYRRYKGGSLTERRELLFACAEAFPGRISTHLIAGLGESEKEMLDLLKECLQRGITVGLFAFTPLKGTVLEKEKQPSLCYYRRLQAARHLLLKGTAPERIVTDTYGKIIIPEEYLDLLRDGEAFRTSGCAGCNRPYYNESPRGSMYNYPRALTGEEIGECVKAVFNSECGMRKSE